jgi:hypothetical protein
MKKLGKILGGVFACLILLLLVFRVTGLEPHGTVPGLWLRGTPVTTPVTDWSYTDKITTDFIQTNTPYMIPHSVTTWCIAYNGQLYVATSKATTRDWPRNVARDPHVRLKIGDQLFDRTLAVVSDESERLGVLQTRAKKYAQPYPEPAGVHFTVYRVMPS